MNNDIKEAVKEGLRVIVLAVIPVVISSLSSGAVDWKLVLTAAAVAALRSIDSWLHNSGVAEKGLTQF